MIFKGVVTFLRFRKSFFSWILETKSKKIDWKKEVET